MTATANENSRRNKSHLLFSYDESLQKDSEEQTKTPAKKKLPTKKCKAPPVYESGDSDAEDLITMYARKTAKGGYAHTKQQVSCSHFPSQ